MFKNSRDKKYLGRPAILYLVFTKLPFLHKNTRMLYDAQILRPPHGYLKRWKHDYQTFRTNNKYIRFLTPQFFANCSSNATTSSKRSSSLKVISSGPNYFEPLLNCFEFKAVNLSEAIRCCRSRYDAERKNIVYNYRILYKIA